MAAWKEKCLAVFDHITECMAPIIPILLAGGILKMIVMLLQNLSILSGSTEVILSAIATAPFYFLPVMVAYTAAKHFQTEPLFAIVSVCVMLLPEFTELMESGERVTFVGIPVISATYAYSVIPVILLVYCMSKITTFLKRYIKESLRPYFLAVCVIFLTALLGILVIQPVVSLLSGWLADGLNTLQLHAPVVAWAILAGLTTFLVSMGMHWIFITIAITQIGLTGADYGIMVAFLISNMSLAGCDLGVLIRTKSRERRSMSLSAMLTALIPGIAEPSIFGICFKERTPLIGNVLGCMIAGALQGIITVRCYIFSFPSIPAILMYYSADEPINIGKAVLVGCVSFMASFLITAAIYRDREESVTAV